MLLVEELFQPPGKPGYVLDFSDRTFAIFFAEELNVDIDDPAYAVNGTSKLRRFKCFLQAVDKAIAIRTLKAAWEYREAKRAQWQQEEKVHNAEGRFLQLIARLEGSEAADGGSKPKPAFDRAKFSELQAALMDLSKIDPAPRGFAFEKYLKRLFDAFDLGARASFRLVGEQIDGSFVLNSETYLLEAKWHNEPTGIGDLHAFHGKLEEKASWTRGLFVSYSGFSPDGLKAFGRAKRLICLDGADLAEALIRELPLNLVLERKVRHAAETGIAFAQVRELF
ncbi:MAG: restriction endonuclease [Rhizobiales bacterium]|nr:restriction endonuclease [Hyphomicrobiales bacterium]